MKYRYVYADAHHCNYAEERVQSGLRRILAEDGKDQFFRENRVTDPENAQ